MDAMYAELEFWDERTGGEILLGALKAAEPFVIAESIHVFTPSVLKARGVDEGECSLWLSVALAPGATPSDFFTSVRAAGIRVKEAGFVPAEVARAEAEGFWAWMHAEYERMRLEWEAEEAERAAAWEAYQRDMGEEG